MTQQEFIKTIASHVQKYAPMFNIGVCSPVIAQAILESAYGTSYKAQFNNYFGLKYRKDRVTCNSGYFEDGGSEQNQDGSYTELPSNTSWYSFESIEMGVLGYFQFISIDKYSNLKGVKDPLKYLDNIKADGYATSKDYVENVYAVIKKWNLTQYDIMEVTKMKKVCIDSGHYGKYNRCPAIASYYESETVWKLSQLQKKYLEMMGISVIITRSDASKDLGLFDRGAKSAGCDLFISNHTNAVGSGMNESVDYVAIYHLTDDTSVKCDDISKEFAGVIAPVIANNMGVSQGGRILSRLSSNDRNGDGVLNDNYYGVLNGARQVGTAGCILEHSFHTNSRTVNWLLNDSNLDKLAKAEAESIASFLLGHTVTVDTTAPVTPSAPTNTNVLYRVQAGAFSKKDNAVAQLNVVKSKGFDTILVEVNGIYKVQVGAYSVKANANNMLNKIKSAGFDAFITIAGGTQVSVSTTPKKSVTDIAKEVIAGKWGNGADRKKKIESAGYTYSEVQAKVNELL